MLIYVSKENMGICNPAKCMISKSISDNIAYDVSTYYDNSIFLNNEIEISYDNSILKRIIKHDIIYGECDLFDGEEYFAGIHKDEMNFELEPFYCELNLENRTLTYLPNFKANEADKFEFEMAK